FVLLFFLLSFLFFFFNDTPTTDIYTLSLHDALPISIPDAGKPEIESPAILPSMAEAAAMMRLRGPRTRWQLLGPRARRHKGMVIDRKSTRLNSSHVAISYAVFCLKKKKKN